MWKFQNCGRGNQLQVYHLRFRSALGDDSLENLITLCEVFRRRTWYSTSQEFDLAVVVGLVFGDMKPLGVVVRGEVAVCDQRC